MTEWWNGLSQINQAFYGAAAFFGVLFIWQLLAAILGLDADDGDAGADMDADASYDDFEHGAAVDAAETTLSFQLVSIRSIITFFTLFTLGGALYMNRGDSVPRAMGVSAIWGTAGMLAVAALVYMLRKMTHTGTKNLSSSIGQTGSVYLNIPENGVGEIRVTVSGMITNVKARTLDGAPLTQGTPVKVTRRLDNLTVEVEVVTRDEDKKDSQPAK